MRRMLLKDESLRGLFMEVWQASQDAEIDVMKRWGPVSRILQAAHTLHAHMHEPFSISIPEQPHIDLLDRGEAWAASAKSISAPACAISS